MLLCHFFDRGALFFYCKILKSQVKNVIIKFMNFTLFGGKMNRIKNIAPADKASAKAAREHWNSVAKPLGSLGLLEEAVEKIAAVQGTPNVKINSRQAVVMCADNGVVKEGVSQSDSSVTALCAKEIAEGRSNINALARLYNASVTAVDIGIENDVESEKLLKRKISCGTKNIAEGAAMTIGQAEKAIAVGMDIVRDSRADIIVTGEMGIGNTTTSAALASVLLDLPPKEVTGRGAGLDSAGLERKISAVERAIAVNRPDKTNPVELLAKLGGYDIAGMTGIFLGGAVYHVPIVIDGVISAVAALLACEICPFAKDYMLASHVSGEKAGKMLLERLELKPLITAEMRLGEGTGGIMLLPLLDGTLSVYNSAHRFDEMGMERYVEQK